MKISKNVTFYVFWTASHVFSNYADEEVTPLEAVFAFVAFFALR